MSCYMQLLHKVRFLPSRIFTIKMEYRINAWKAIREQCKIELCQEMYFVIDYESHESFKSQKGIMKENRHAVDLMVIELGCVGCQIAPQSLTYSLKSKLFWEPKGFVVLGQTCVQNEDAKILNCLIRGCGPRPCLGQHVIYGLRRVLLFQHLNCSKSIKHI